MQLLKTLKWHVSLTLHFYLTARSRENAANILMYFPHCVCPQLRSPAPSYKPMCDFSGLIPRQGFPWQPHQESCGPGPSLGTQLGHPSLWRESHSLVSGLLASQALHMFTSLTLVSSCPGLLPWGLGRKSSRHLSWDICVEWRPCHGDSGLSTHPLSVLPSPTLGSVKLPEPLIQDPFNTEISPHQCWSTCASTKVSFHGENETGGS